MDYPVVLIPSLLEKTKQAEPPVPQFTEPQPQSPSKEPRKVNQETVALEVVAATVPTVAVGSQNMGTGFLVFLAAVIAIGGHVWAQISSYPRRRELYRNEVENYRQKLTDFQQKQRQHAEKVKKLLEPDKVAEFRYKLLLETLKRTLPPDGSGSFAQKGWAEDSFYRHLNRYFPGKIHQSLFLQIPNFPHPYTADFVYFDPQFNLRIDIEVDEPYAYKTLEPTHYLGSNTEERRNSFFLSKGWIVIRFSEEQVVRHPKSCCKTIAIELSNLLGKSANLDQFKNVPNLTPVKRWTKAEAEEMKNTRYRDTYKKFIA